MIRSNDFGDFGAEIEKMHLANGRDVPNPLVVEAYWETLQDLSWDEFKAGVFTSRQNNGRGYLPSDGVIREEALKARGYLSEQARRAIRARSLESMPVDPTWGSLETPTHQELAEGYAKAAELARRNHNQALKERNSAILGSPEYGDAHERKVRYRSDYERFLELHREHTIADERGEVHTAAPEVHRAMLAIAERMLRK